MINIKLSNKSKPQLKNSKGGSNMNSESNLSRASKIVSGYHITIKRNKKFGFNGSSIEMPFVSVNAGTLGECHEATEKALINVIVAIIESGKKPPLTGSPEKRTEQVNIRFRPDEKMLLAKVASELGFRGLSDFVRNCAIKASFKH